LRADDGGVAGADGLGLTERVDRGARVVVGAVVAQRRDVLDRAVAERRLDGELALFAGLLEGVLRRRHGDGLHLAAALGPAGALHDPLADQLVRPGILAEPGQPAVFDLPGRL